MTRAGERKMTRSIGLLGGMSWHSTVTYYTELNKLHHQKWGGLSSASIHLRSYDFSRLAKLSQQGDWEEIGNIFVESSHHLIVGGAECIAIACNTMHEVAPFVQSLIDVPLLSIVDAVGEKLRQGGSNKARLYATKQTVDCGFYQQILGQDYDVEVAVPNAEEVKRVHNIIVRELARGKISGSGVSWLQQQVHQAVESGETVLLCCTELGLAILPTKYPDGTVLDSALVHIESLHRFASDLQH